MVLKAVTPGQYWGSLGTVFGVVLRLLVLTRHLIGIDCFMPFYSLQNSRCEIIISSVFYSFNNICKVM